MLYTYIFGGVDYIRFRYGVHTTSCQQSYVSSFFFSPSWWSSCSCNYYSVLLSTFSPALDLA